MKKCSKCKIEKEYTEFCKVSKTKDGYYGYCKQCSSAINKERYQKNKEAHKLKVKKWQKDNKESHLNTRLKRLYSITIDEYNVMFEEQDGKCKICEVHQSEITRSLCVDHCHSSGKVRGLLCPRCNRSLGLLKDNVDILQKAIDYLI